MNILILGSGGRENAFSWKIAQSPKCSNLFIAPGNAGSDKFGTRLELNINNFEAVAQALVTHQISLLIIGPEEPLVKGLVNFLKAQKQFETLAIIGPEQTGAMLEGSKAFAKEFMQKFNIPTAAYREFNKASLEEALTYIDSYPGPYVLKADGLAAGKGVVILEDANAAKSEIKEMLNGKFGEASAKVVVEQFLKGIEFSVFGLFDGENYLVLPEAKDYKRIGLADTGLNTGGMGAISPVPFCSKELMQKVEEQIIKPTFKGIKELGIDYHGFVFFGLILVEDQPFVIEYNCRMGDPETEAVIPRIKNDLVELLMAAAKGELKSQTLDITSQHAATVMLVSGGYPEAFEKGKVITNLEKINDQALVFHAGTTSDSDGQIRTNGGRVIAVTSLDTTLENALQNALKSAEVIDYQGKYFRTDIGYEFV